MAKDQSWIADLLKGGGHPIQIDGAQLDDQAGLNILSTHFKVTTSGTTTSLQIVGVQQIYNVQDPAYGAVGDGTTNDATAIQAAITDAVAVNGLVYFPRTANGYKITSQITISGACTLKGDGATIIPAFDPTANTSKIAFSVQASDVTFEGLRFDGTTLTAAAGTLQGNRYVISCLGSSGSRRSDLTIKSCWFKNLNQYGGTLPASGTGANSGVWHGIFVQYVDRVKVTDCTLLSANSSTMALSGSFTDFLSVSYYQVLRNYVYNTGWYSIHDECDCHYGEIGNNVIQNVTATGTYWGGFIHLMGQTTTTKLTGDSHIRIHHNDISGNCPYSQGIGIAGAHYVEIDNNVLHDMYNTDLSSEMDYFSIGVRGPFTYTTPAVTDGSTAVLTGCTNNATWTFGTYATYIKKSTAGITDGSKVLSIDTVAHTITLDQVTTSAHSITLTGYAVMEAPSDIDIHDNILIAHGTKKFALYAQGMTGVDGNNGQAFVNIRFRGNRVLSPDSTGSHYFDGVFFVGHDSGIQHCQVDDNYLVVANHNGPVGGCVAFTANSQVGYDLSIRRNQMVYAPGVASANSSTQYAISVGQTDEITVRDNWGTGFYSGVNYASTNTSNGRHLYDNRWVNSFEPWDVNLNGLTMLSGNLANVAVAGNTITWTGTTSVASQAFSYTTLNTTVGGAALNSRPGDTVVVGLPSTWPAGLVVDAFISSNNVVKIIVTNPTAGGLTIPSASSDIFNIRVIRTGQ